MSTIRTYVALALMLLPAVPVCHGQEVKGDPSLDEIMAPLTINDSLLDAALRVSAASERVKEQADLRSAQELVADLHYLSTSCLYYRRMGRDAGWHTLRPAVSALLSRVRSAVAVAGGKNPLVSESADLLQALEECRNACSGPISKQWQKR